MNTTTDSLTALQALQAPTRPADSIEIPSVRLKAAEAHLNGALYWIKSSNQAFAAGQAERAEKHARYAREDIAQALRRDRVRMTLNKELGHRYIVRFDGVSIGWLIRASWGQDEGTWSAYIRTPGQDKGERVSHVCRTREMALELLLDELDHRSQTPEQSRREGFLGIAYGEAYWEDFLTTTTTTSQETI